MKYHQRKPSEIPKSLKTVDVKALLRKRGMYTKLFQNQALKEEAKAMARQIVESKKKQKEPAEKRRHSQFTNDDLNDYWQKQIHIVETIEQHFEDKLRQFISKIEKDFLSQIESEIDSKKAIKKGFFDDSEAEYLLKAQFDFTPLLESVATLAGSEAMKLTGSDLVYVPFAYRDKIKKNVDKFAKSLFDTDRDHLTGILLDGLESGKSIPQIRNQITEEFPEYTKNQAQKITRTEVLRTSNQSAIDAYEQSGVVEGKQWLTAGAVDECAQYEGQIESLSGNFYSNTSEFADGDPPLHPNCRCVVLPIVIDSR